MKENKKRKRKEKEKSRKYTNSTYSSSQLLFPYLG